MSADDTAVPAASGKRMRIAEFVAQGYLHELNRQFLHPLGLALEVVVKDGEIRSFGGVWDDRDDPEGLIYGDDLLSPEKAARIAAIAAARKPVRKELLGYVIQPVDRAAKEDG